MTKENFEREAGKKNDPSEKIFRPSVFNKYPKKSDVKYSNKKASNIGGISPSEVSIDDQI